MFLGASFYIPRAKNMHKFMMKRIVFYIPPREQSSRPPFVPRFVQNHETCSAAFLLSARVSSRGSGLPLLRDMPVLQPEQLSGMSPGVGDGAVGGVRPQHGPDPRSCQDQHGVRFVRSQFPHQDHRSFQVSNILCKSIRDNACFFQPS